MMEEFKNTPLELDNTMPKDLYEIVENGKRNKRIHIGTNDAIID